MTIDALIMLAGSLVAILPFLGFPNSWDDVMFFVLGVIIVAFGIVVRRRRPAEKPPVPRKRTTFSESTPQFSPSTPVHEIAGQ